MRTSVVLSCALICAVAFIDLSGAQATCPPDSAVLASFSSLSSKCGTTLTKKQQEQLTIIGQFITSAIKFAKESVTQLKVKPNEVNAKLAKILPDTFLNTMVASVGTAGGPTTNMATRPDSNRLAGSPVAPGGVLLETSSPAGSLTGNGNPPNSLNLGLPTSLAAPDTVQPPFNINNGKPDIVNPGANPPPAGAAGCNDALLKALSSASCRITGLPLLDQLIGGFAGAFTTSAGALAKLSEWCQMIDAQVAAIEQRKDRKPAGYEPPPPPPTGPAKPAPTTAPAGNAGTGGVPGAAGTLNPASGAPRATPAPAGARPGSFLQLHSQRVNLRQKLKSQSPSFPTIYQNGGQWITRMGCTDPTAAADMAVLATATNGCSVPGGWYLYIGTFTDACQIHDMCYGCPTLGVRKTCDNEFYDNMINLCTDKYCRKYLDSIQRGFCYDTTSDYWAGVRVGGGSHFATADKPYCSKICPARMTHFRIRWDGRWC